MLSPRLSVFYSWLDTYLSTFFGYAHVAKKNYVDCHEDWRKITTLHAEMRQFCRVQSISIVQLHFVFFLPCELYSLARVLYICIDHLLHECGDLSSYFVFTAPA